MKNKPNVAFFGTPEFAATALNSILESKIVNVSLVVCQPDSRKGRSKKLLPPPVKTVALNNNLKVAQPEKIKYNHEFKDLLLKINPDCILVVAYGKILPKWLLDIPHFACLNIHGSILPKYRGASPIHGVLLNNESKTGVSIMKLDEGLDTGDVISIKTLDINPKDTFQTLHDKLALLGAATIVETLPLWFDGKIKVQQQDDKASTLTSLIKKEHGLINWSLTTDKLHGMVRAYDPWPSAYSYVNGKQIKFFNSCISSNDKYQSTTPGQVVECTDHLLIKTGDGFIGIHEIQLEGGKRLPVKDLIRGHSYLSQSIFTNKRE